MILIGLQEASVAGFFARIHYYSLPTLGFIFTMLDLWARTRHIGRTMGGSEPGGQRVSTVAHFLHILIFAKTENKYYIFCENCENAKMAKLA